MQTDTAAEYLTKKLKAQRTIIEESVISGKLNLEEYKRMTGMHYGVNYAIELIEDTAKKVANEELGDE
jgi:hypothetical protein